jgi:hypothetical protein
MLQRAPPLVACTHRDGLPLLIRSQVRVPRTVIAKEPCPNSSRMVLRLTSAWTPREAKW